MKIGGSPWYNGAMETTKVTTASLAHLAMRAHLTDEDPDFLFLSADEQEERISEQLEFDRDVALFGVPA